MATWKLTNSKSKIQNPKFPTVDEERALRVQGYDLIAGIDEAGRGCWAGPVVAAAVILSDTCLEHPDLLRGVNDSKQLTAAQRERMLKLIHTYAAGVGVGVVPAYLIDSLGIVPATRLAMEVALVSLQLLPHALLIDATCLPNVPLPQRGIIRGDSISLSIAAASIVAKTTRDRLMTQFDTWYPAFRFGTHKGYGTALHAHALRIHGLTPLHRRSFRPIIAMEDV